MPELPDDPALCARTLAAAGYFRDHRFFRRGPKACRDYYQDNARRVALEGTVGDLGSYLSFVEHEDYVCAVRRDGASAHRAVDQQIESIGLTTRRYTELDVAAFEDDPDRFHDAGSLSRCVWR